MGNTKTTSTWPGPCFTIVPVRAARATIDVFTALLAVMSLDTRLSPKRAWHLFLISLAGAWLKNIISCHSPPPPSLLVGPDKPFDRTIIGLLHVIRKEAGRQLSHPPMISYTFAANTLSVARLIAAVTFCFVLLNGALSHVQSPSIAVWLNAFPSPNSLCLRGLFAPPPEPASLFLLHLAC